jgi:hypothetical protein
VPQRFPAVTVIRAGHGPSLIMLKEKPGMRQSLSARASLAKQVIKKTSTTGPIRMNDPHHDER